MKKEMVEFLSTQQLIHSQAYIRNLVSAENAVLKGQFNIAKILRAAAYTQRTLAMNAVRLLIGIQTPQESLRSIVTEVQHKPSKSGLDEDDTARQQLEHFDNVHQRLEAIILHALQSLEKNVDVLEKDVHPFINGCYNCGNLIEGDLPDACDICGALGVEFERFGPFYAATPEHLGQLTPEKIIAIMIDVPKQVSALIMNADDAHLSYKPAENEWSIKEIAAHMFEVDKLFLTRVKAVLHQSEYNQSVPPWKLHEGKGYNTMPAEMLLDQLHDARKESLAFVSGLSKQDWSSRGIMLGESRSILDLGTWLANHDRGHLAQIEQRLSTF